MTSINISNQGLAIGRLTREITVRTNAENKNVILFTLAVKDNFKNKDGVRSAQFINFKAFTSEKLGVYEYMHKGDMVAVSYTIRSEQYEDKDGNTVYNQALVVTGVQLLSSAAKKEDQQDLSMQWEDEGDMPLE